MRPNNSLRLCHCFLLFLVVALLPCSLCLAHQVNPAPTSDAIKNGIQGTVQLHVVIGIEGNVKQVDVLSGPPELTAAATDAVKQWRYQPTLLNGDPVEVDTTVSISFALGG